MIPKIQIIQCDCLERLAEDSLLKTNNMTPPKIVHLLSGGLDSTVLLYEHVKDGSMVHCVLFNYGQRHIRELEFAREHCRTLQVPFDEIELWRVKNLFQRCALTDGKSDSVVVPNRNAVMLHIAAAIAASNGAEIVTYACNKDDQAMFPDCTWEFVEAMNATMKASKTAVEICAPYIGLTKRQIVQRARKVIGMPESCLEGTWSCYAPQPEPCGKCDACLKRAEAFK